MQKFKFFTLAIIAMLSVNFAWGADKTFSMTELGGLGSSASTGGDFSVTVSPITVSGTKGNGISSSEHFRLYSGGTLTVSSSTATLTSIAFTCIANNTSDYGPAKITLKSGEKGSYSYSGKVGTWTYATGTQSVTFSLSAQARVTQIVVTYTASATPTITTSANSLAFGSIENNTTKSLSTLTVSGSNLTNNITFSITGTNASYFTVTDPASISKGTGTVAATAITVQYAPKATGSHTATLQIISSGATTKEVTLTGTATAPAVKHNVNWYVNGTKTKTDAVTEGAAITLPSAPSAPSSCSDKVFYGWTTSSSYSSATTAPSIISNPTMGTSDLNYYAVFADEVSGENSWEKVTTIMGFTPGTYVFGYESNDGFIPMRKETNNTSTGVNTYLRAGTTAGSSAATTLTLTASTDVTAYAVTIGAGSVDGTITIHNGTYYIGVGTSSGNIHNEETAEDWKPAISNNVLILKHNTSETYIFQYNTSNPRFSAYTSNQGKPSFYKWTSNTSYSNYTTNCVACTNLITITKGTATGGTYTLKAGSASGAEIADGGTVDNCDANATIVVVPNANSHYHCTGVTASNSASVTGPDGSGNYTITYTKDSRITSTINVTFAEDTKVVVTLLNNNNPVNAGGFDEHGQKEYYTGETLGTLPTLTSDDACDATSVTFMGWTTDAGFQKRAAPPSSFVSASTPATDGMILRAVWARAQ